VHSSTTMRNAYDLINAGDIDGFGRLMAEGFVEHQGNPGFAPDKAGTLDFFRALLGAFSGWRMDVEDIVAGDDKAVARVHLTGTHTGEFMGIVPSGAKVDIQLIDIMAFDEAGLVCEHWGVADMLTMMQQLGVVPAVPAA